MNRSPQRMHAKGLGRNPEPVCNDVVNAGRDFCFGLDPDGNDRTAWIVDGAAKVLDWPCSESPVVLGVHSEVVPARKKETARLRVRINK